jgi:hypothetical protein
MIFVPVHPPAGRQAAGLRRSLSSGRSTGRARLQAAEIEINLLLPPQLRLRPRHSAHQHPPSRLLATQRTPPPRLDLGPRHLDRHRTWLVPRHPPRRRLQRPRPKRMTSRHRNCTASPRPTSPGSLFSRLHALFGELMPGSDLWLSRCSLVCRTGLGGCSQHFRRPANLRQRP